MVDPAVGAHLWHLTADPGVAALAASRILPKRAVWFTSPEPKAVESAALLGAREARVVPDLREADRGGIWIEDQHEYRATVSRYLAEGVGPLDSRWEARDAVTRRLVAVARYIREQTGRKNVVLVGHGAAFTLLVGELVGRPPDVNGWIGLGLPDHCALDWRDQNRRARLTIPWGSWR
jgi:broad specificity phosphatase PhoE